jgi:hypothetical protein
MTSPIRVEDFNITPIVQQDITKITQQQAKKPEYNLDGIPIT